MLKINLKKSEIKILQNIFNYYNDIEEYLNIYPELGKHFCASESFSINSKSECGFLFNFNDYKLYLSLKPNKMSHIKYKNITIISFIYSIKKANIICNKYINNIDNESIFSYIMILLNDFFKTYNKNIIKIAKTAEKIAKRNIQMKNFNI